MELARSPVSRPGTGELTTIFARNPLAGWLICHFGLCEPLMNHDTDRSVRQTSLLYHTSLIFSYTSLWPGQCLGPGAAPQEEVRHHAAAIFSIAESVMAQSKENCWRSVTFPVFLAGSVTSSSDLKVIALDMLSRLEVREIGRNATSIRYLFQVVYERQMQQSQGVGHPGSADWMEILAEHGLSLVASA